MVGVGAGGGGTRLAGRGMAVFSWFRSTPLFVCLTRAGLSQWRGSGLR
jgi:hypothetical protein